MGTPCGSSHFGSIDGHCDAGAVKRALGARPSPWTRGPVAPLPIESRAWRSLGHASHHTSPSSVSATLVKMQFLVTAGHRVRVRVRAGAGRHAEEARLGVDGVQLPVLAGLDPRDVVAARSRSSSLRSRPAAPASRSWSCRTPTGTPAATYVFSPSGRSTPRMSMCSANQPSSRPSPRRCAARSTSCEQRVAA